MWSRPYLFHHWGLLWSCGKWYCLLHGRALGKDPTMQIHFYLAKSIKVSVICVIYPRVDSMYDSYIGRDLQFKIHIYI